MGIQPLKANVGKVWADFIANYGAQLAQTNGVKLVAGFRTAAVGGCQGLSSWKYMMPPCACFRLLKPLEEYGSVVTLAMELASWK